MQFCAVAIVDTPNYLYYLSTYLVPPTGPSGPGSVLSIE